MKIRNYYYQLQLITILKEMFKRKIININIIIFNKLWHLIS